MQPGDLDEDLRALVRRQRALERGVRGVEGAPRLGGAALRDAADDLARVGRADLDPVAGLDPLAVDQQLAFGRGGGHAPSLRAYAFAVPIVARISITPVKGFQMALPEEVELTADGVVENRRFLLAGADGKRVRSSKNAGTPRSAPTTTRPPRPCMRFPDGSEVEGSARPTGEPFVLRYHTGRVRCDPSRASGRRSSPSLPGTACSSSGPAARRGARRAGDARLAGLGRAARARGRSGGTAGVSGCCSLGGCERSTRRTSGRAGRSGSAKAVVRPTLAVERCAVTTRDPETGRRDLDTLHLIRGYREPRGDVQIRFGMLADVEAPGRVRFGDPVEPL